MKSICLVNISRIIILAVLLGFSSISSNAEVYKWTDERGNVHFGDKAPSDEIQPVDPESLTGMNIIPAIEMPEFQPTVSNFIPDNGEYRSYRHSITGRLLYDGKPIGVDKNVLVSFWMRDEDTGKKADYQIKFDPADSAFYVDSLRPGKYGVSIDVDKNSLNAISYPGDYRAWANFEIKKGYSIKRDINLDQIIHLTAPQDNNKLIDGWSNPCGDKKSFDSPLKISWKSQGIGVRYTYTVRNNPCEPFSYGEPVAQGSTTKTSVTLRLPRTSQNKQYMLELKAYRDNLLIGSLITHGKNGMGWDYRFLIK